MRKTIPFLTTALLMQGLLIVSSSANAAESGSRGSSDTTFDDRPELYFRSNPSYTNGTPVGHISSIKKEQDLVFNGGIAFSKEDGKLNDWVDMTYKNKQAWLHSRGAREALRRLGVSNPAGELKRITAPKKAVAAAAPAQGPTSAQHFSTQYFSYTNTDRAPAAHMPSGLTQGAQATATANAPYQGLMYSAGGPLGTSAAGGGAAAGSGPADPKTTWTNPTSPGVLVPICAKTKAQYDENKILQKAFEGNKDPFTAWTDPANDASLSPNGQGQWDLMVQGALLKTLPIQVCVEKEGAEPYLAIWNKRFDIKENGTVQTVFLEDVEGVKGKFSQQPAKATAKQNVVR